jgi:hypothetical protein
MLTGKAKADFEKWIWSSEEYYVKPIAQYDGYYGKREYEPVVYDVFDNLPKNMQYSVIIDWLDNVGLHVDVISVPKNNTVSFAGVIVATEDITYPDELKPYRLTRNEATKSAIEKSNEIYNASQDALKTEKV